MVRSSDGQEEEEEDDAYTQRKEQTRIGSSSDTEFKSLRLMVAQSESFSSSRVQHIHTHPLYQVATREIIYFIS